MRLKTSRTMGIPPNVISQKHRDATANNPNNRSRFTLHRPEYNVLVCDLLGVEIVHDEELVEKSVDLGDSKLAQCLLGGRDP